jgi:hypothetical protein
MKNFFIFIFLMLLVVPYQNCSSKIQFLGPSQKSQMSGGNGDSYSGKPGTFLYFDHAAQCTKLDKNGQPFPNSQIFVTGTIASLVRVDCHDIEPIVLDPSTYTLDAVTGTVVYQGRTFDYQTDLTVYVKTDIPCPSGMSPIANAMPTNMINDALQWSSSNWISGYNSVALFGSIEALPRYRIERTDPLRLENWRRVSQLKFLVAGEMYAFSTVLLPGNTDNAILHYYYGDSNQFGVNVNIPTGATQFSHNIGMPGVTAASSPYGAGRLVTVFFTAPVGANGSDVGVATSNPTSMPASVGDYVYATAGSLQLVNSYCN